MDWNGHWRNSLCKNFVSNFHRVLSNSRNVCAQLQTDIFFSSIVFSFLCVEPGMCNDAWRCLIKDSFYRDSQSLCGWKMEAEICDFPDKIFLRMQICVTLVGSGALGPLNINWNIDSNEHWVKYKTSLFFRTNLLKANVMFRLSFLSGMQEEGKLHMPKNRQQFVANPTKVDLEMHTRTWKIHKFRSQAEGCRLS